MLFAYSPEVNEVRRVDATRSDEVDATWGLTIEGGSRTYQITSVGDRWAVLDAGTRILYLDGRTVDLTDADRRDRRPAAAAARPGVGPPADRHQHGAAQRAVQRREPGAAGRRTSPAPAPPRSCSAGCEYGAWSNGTAWRRCAGDGGSGVELALDEMAGSARPDVLGEHRARRAQRRPQRRRPGPIQQNGELIDNWDDLIVEDEDQQQEENDEDVPPDIDEEQKPPVAVDDEFGARPGRATLLPVLLNDYDPNADVLVITQTSGVSENIGHLDLVTRNQQLQLTLNEDVSGPISFSYTISDGRGGTATATVTVDRARAGRELAAAAGAHDQDHRRGGRPDLDPGGRRLGRPRRRRLLPGRTRRPRIPTGSATSRTASWCSPTPAQGGALKTVTLTMSDGAAEGSGSLAVTVKEAGEVPIVIEPWVALTTAGPGDHDPARCSHVRGGNGTLRLNAVPAKAGSTIEPSFEAGTFTFKSDDVRTHYVEFTVTDGDLTATGAGAHRRRGAAGRQHPADHGAADDLRDAR